MLYNKKNKVNFKAIRSLLRFWGKGRVISFLLQKKHKKYIMFLTQNYSMNLCFINLV